MHDCCEFSYGYVLFVHEDSGNLVCQDVQSVFVDLYGFDFVDCCVLDCADGFQCVVGVNCDDDAF